ncbi:MAG: 16S rRNA (adenine(1518)-N(6)/adenine(1519)-N(6))-dimethyltransferase RsmA [Peptococcaceae bacterium]|nr:MAG: 16S rRNA (adenine(1518)-N(6)/adenine(1519)-N(6))-dimethyltransferase RsmA [Peptococcaceae bacterium]
MHNLASVAGTRALLRNYGFRYRKSLGQNFLVDPGIIQKIVDAVEPALMDVIVEIGPGLGTLTKQVAGHVGKVLAVEIDRHLLPILADTLGGLESHVEVIQGDALEIDFDRLVAAKTAGEFGQGGRPYKLVANLPYYITGPLLTRLVLERFNTSVMVVMVQQEVAARLTAAPGNKNYGSLSVLVRYFTEPEMVFRVPRTVFYPVPGVDSAVVRLRVRPEPAVRVLDEALFFKIVRAAFALRRKNILNALSGAMGGISKEKWRIILAKAGIDPGRRGETFSLAEFAAVADRIKAL